MGSPLEPQEELSATDTLILAQWDLFQASDLQNRKRITVCCFKPLSL